jgi:hypothetical protein
MSSSDEEEYVVEEICDIRTQGGVLQYEVKWRGFGASDNTWEPVDNLVGCAEALKAFQRGAGKTSKKAPAKAKATAVPVKPITKNKKLVKVPRIKNPDDDEQVEAHKAAKATNAAATAAAAEKERLGQVSPDAAHAEVIANLKAILGNLADGVPLLLSNVYVTVRTDPAEGLKQGSVVVLAHKESHTPSVDGKLLEELCGDDCMGASDLLNEFIGRKGGLGRAMPDLVQAGVRAKIIPAQDGASLTARPPHPPCPIRVSVCLRVTADRLARKFSGWLKGVGWGKCQLSHTNRPSLGSWKGWPWECSDDLVRKALSVPARRGTVHVLLKGLFPYRVARFSSEF